MVRRRVTLEDLVKDSSLAGEDALWHKYAADKYHQKGISFEAFATMVNNLLDLYDDGMIDIKGDHILYIQGRSTDEIRRGWSDFN